MVTNDDQGEICWHVGHLAVDGLARTVTAQPLNRSYPARLEASTRDWVTVLVDSDRVPTPRPHGQRITAHNPTKRGWYSDPGGWDVGCGCGWTAGDVVQGSQDAALTAWTVHKAGVVSELLAHTDRGWPRAYLVPAPARGRADAGEWPFRLVKRP